MAAKGPPRRSTSAPIRASETQHVVPGGAWLGRLEQPPSQVGSGRNKTRCGATSLQVISAKSTIRRTPDNSRVSVITSTMSIADSINWR